MKIGLTDFRAFAETKLIDVRPLTFLVGENSSGKTSFLSALNYIWRFQERMQVASFNQPPFDLGTFDEIVHRVRGRTRPDTFVVAVENAITISPSRGLRYSPPGITRQTGVAHLRLSFGNNVGEAELKSLFLSFSDLSLWIDFLGDVRTEVRKAGTVVFSSKGGDIELPFPRSTTPGVNLDASYIDFFLRRQLLDKTDFRENPASEKVISLSTVAAAFSTLTDSFPRTIFASAPVRSNPSRVYTPADQSRSPEGRHTPQILFKVKETDKARWENVKKGLEEFGHLSGMFSKIDVSRFRRSGSSPFQISITLKGKQSNIVDVGYGVSQTLPIITDLIEGGPRSAFLFQQPEVHLHPQAQAALGSFLSKYASEHRGSYIIAETHSDHMIDRARYEVKRGVLSPNDVAILYFESAGTDVSVHQISLDIEGNVVGAPVGYREFFVIEQMKMLGLDVDDVPRH